jgi:phosphate starvation-inducible membrane PsiE
VYVGYKVLVMVSIQANLVTSDLARWSLQVNEYRTMMVLLLLFLSADFIAFSWRQFLTSFHFVYVSQWRTEGGWGFNPPPPQIPKFRQS